MDNDFSHIRMLSKVTTAKYSIPVFIGRDMVRFYYPPCWVLNPRIYELAMILDAAADEKGSAGIGAVGVRTMAGYDPYYSFIWGAL